VGRLYDSLLRYNAHARRVRPPAESYEVIEDGKAIDCVTQARRF